MNPIPVFDISSDEEPPLDEPKGWDDDYAWLTELLDTVDRETEESDEVVVVDEYRPSVPKSNSKSSRPAKDVEDDDCVVLDGDPDKPVAVANGDAEDIDDVLVVGQTGKIACRDYPHPRHLCLTFPFSSTPHERHCELCHCYVCDLVAPCAYWGTGVSSADHCHATDKQHLWKSQRESFRRAKVFPSPISNFPVPLPVGAPQPKQVEPLLAPNSMPNNQMSRPATIRACSSTSLGIPSVISQGRSRQSSGVESRSRFCRRSTSHHVLGVHNKYIQRDRGSNVGNFGQQFVSSHPMYRRANTIRGASAMSQSLYGSANKTSCAPPLQCTMDTAPLTTSTNTNHAGQHALPSAISESFNLRCPSQTNIMSNLGVQSRPEICISSIPQLNDGQNIYQLGNQSQHILDSSSNFGFCSVNNPIKSNWQTSAENILSPGTEHNNNRSTGEQVGSQYGGTENSQLWCNNQEFESWLSTQSVPFTAEDSVVSGLDLFCPEAGAVDVGMLCFDFEPSWDLTQL